MRSMTGFGQTRIETDLLKAELTIKSWNNRFLDLNISIPSYLSSIERKIRDTVSKFVGRGKVDLYLKILSIDMPVSVQVDTESASSVASAIRQLAKAASINEDVNLSHLLSVDGILSFERNIDSDTLWLAIEEKLLECLRAFDSERIREGKATEDDLNSKLSILESSLAVIEKLCPEIEQNIKDTLRQRFAEVLGSNVDENRILTEIASYLAKYTINEEIVRLSSHIAAFRKAMKEELCGKKLDFICQEMNRESNTIGSKSGDYRISEAVIRMKDAIENIREQIRNIE